MKAHKYSAINEEGKTNSNYGKDWPKDFISHNSCIIWWIQQNSRLHKPA